MLIDDEDFSLGIPTLEQMLRQQAVLLENECHQLMSELGQARRGIAQLVAMNDQLTAESAKLKATVHDQTWLLSKEYVRTSQLTNLLRCSGIVLWDETALEVEENYQKALANAKAYAARAGKP